MREFKFKEKYKDLITDLINYYEQKNKRKYIMGPDGVRLLEILCEKIKLEPGMRVLDMGCGLGFSSIILAKEFGVTVFANDMWTSASDNYEIFQKAGVSNQVFPIHAEAHALPYANGFFDAAISIDSYHYYGTDECYLSDCYAKLVKQGGQFGLVNPGLTREFENGLPAGLVPYWEPNMYAWHSSKWWHQMWQKSNLVDVICAEDIPEGKELWRSTADYELHDADIENYLTLVLMTAIKK